MFLGTPIRYNSSSFIQTSSVMHNETSPNPEVSSIPKSMCKMFLLFITIDKLHMHYFCIVNLYFVAGVSIVTAIPIATLIISIAIIISVFVIIGAVKKIRRVRLNNGGIS